MKTRQFTHHTATLQSMLDRPHPDERGGVHRPRPIRVHHTQVSVVKNRLHCADLTQALWRKRGGEGRGKGGRGGEGEGRGGERRKGWEGVKGDGAKSQCRGQRSEVKGHTSLLRGHPKAHLLHLLIPSPMAVLHGTEGILVKCNLDSVSSSKHHFLRGFWRGTWDSPWVEEGKGRRDGVVMETWTPRNINSGGASTRQNELH